MIRKLFIVGTLAALPLGVLVHANSALAGPPPIDVSNAKITCTSVIGAAKLKPGLTFTGASPATIQVKGTVAGCTVTNAPSPVTITGGKFKGVLTSGSNNCGNLLGANAVSGSITFSWKADSTTPINLKTSTLTPGTLTGGTFAPAALSPATYGDFTVGASTLTGAFTGADGGATVHAVLATSQSTDAETTLCNSTKGLSAINLGLGILELQ